MDLFRKLCISIAKRIIFVCLRLNLKNTKQRYGIV